MNEEEIQGLFEKRETLVAGMLRLHLAIFEFEKALQDAQVVVKLQCEVG